MAKKETILNQEDLIASLADEIKQMQGKGAKKSVIRDQLMEIAEKDLQKQALRQNKNSNLALYIQAQQDEERLAQL